MVERGYHGNALGSLPGSPSPCICNLGCPHRSDEASCDGGTKVKDLICETIRSGVFWDDGPLSKEGLLTPRQKGGCVDNRATFYSVSVQ